MSSVPHAVAGSQMKGIHPIPRQRSLGAKTQVTAAKETGP